MGKASSAKKLARAARTGKVSTKRERRDMGFPLVIALVIVLGTSLVLYARSTRADAVSPKLNVGVAGGGGGDHWHAAIGFYNCDHFEDNITRGADWPDSTGIHSHDDGVIHIHPFTSAASGTRARLKVFFQTMDVKFTDKEVDLTNGVVMKDGADCNGKTAHLKVARFQVDHPDQAPQIYESNLGEIRFLADREAFTVALVPDGADIPIPPTASQLDALAGLDTGQSTGATATPSTSVPDPNAPTTLAGDPNAPTSTVPPTTSVAPTSSR
jgi:hypothetical protein